MGGAGLGMIAPSRPALRPFLQPDLPVLAAIFQASVEELTGDEYSPAQQTVWAALAEDEAAFAARLAQGLTLVATKEGAPVGFAVLKGADHIDMLYVYPGAVGQGVATLLVDALEKLAAARGAARLSVDASDTSRGFFEKRGFEPQRRNTVPLGDEWLGNTTLLKLLGAPEKGPPT